jgi:hypothetical protein
MSMIRFPLPATWRVRGLAFALAAGSIAGITYLLGCNGGSGGGVDLGDAGGPLSVPAVFVIDSTGKLFSFDIAGIPLQSVALPGPVGPLQGAGIAYQGASPATPSTTPVGALPGGGTGTPGTTATAGGFPSPTLFVTLGAPANRVAAYTLDLAPQTWLTPQLFDSGLYFPDLQAPRGIAYAADYTYFYVASAGSSDGGRSRVSGCVDDVGQIEGVCGFNSAGSPFPFAEDCAAFNASVCITSGPAGVAWDPDDHTIWVANYLGAPQTSGPQLGVSEYLYSGGIAQTFDYSTQFQPKPPHDEPYSIAVCPKAATGGQTVVVVGFIDDGSGDGVGTVEAYSTGGTPLGYALSPLIAPYALSCDANGDVYIADKAGLYQMPVAALMTNAITTPSTPSGFTGLTPPIYGVYVRTDLGSATDGGAGSDATGGETATADAGPPDAQGFIDAGLPDVAPPDAALVQIDCTPTNPGWNGTVPITIPDGGDCVVTGPITTDTTFSASQCPVYDAPGGIVVTGGTLTIEAGVTVAFGNGTGLQVAATSSAGLQVEGSTSPTSCAPVVFTSDAPSPTAGSWGTVELDSNLTDNSAISNLVIQYAGGAYNGPVFSPAVQAALLVDGTGHDIQLPISNVTAWQNGGSGIVFLGKNTGPAQGSSGALSVTDWPASANPFQIDAAAAFLLPSVHLQSQPVYPATTIIPRDGPDPLGWVYLYTTPNTDTTWPIDQDTTWPAIPMPYVLGEQANGATYMWINGAGATAATLTIESPNTIQIGPQYWFNVDTNGVLVAEGNITFEPIPPGDSPDAATAGEWGGFYFSGWGGTMSRSSLVGVTISGAAGPASSGPALYCSDDPAAIMLVGGNGCQCPPTLEDITFLSQPSESYAIDGENIDPTSVDALTYSDGNNFVGIQPVEWPCNNQCQPDSCNQSPPATCPSSAPTPGTLCPGSAAPCTYANANPPATCVCVQTSSGWEWSCT